jgi:hypothetical protein
MNASRTRRTEVALRAVCALVPAVLAAAHVPNVADAAHDRGVSHVLGLRAEPWRTLDLAAGVLLTPLPLGTLAARAALGGTLVIAAAGVILYAIACHLLRARGEPGRLGYAVAAIATSAALVAGPWQIEAAAVGSSATGATLVLLALLFVMRASERGSRTAWMAAALTLGLALGQEPWVLASAIAGVAAFVTSSSYGRAAAVRAWRDQKVAVAACIAMGLAPLLFALVHVRFSGAPSTEAAAEAWADPTVLGFSSFAFVLKEIGPVLTLFAAAGGLVGLLTERARGPAAGLGAVVATGFACGSLGASVGPTRFAAPVLAADAAMCALAAISMLGIVRAVAEARVPLARTAAGLFVVLELVIPVDAADEALVRCARRASATAAWWDDAVWSTLEPRTVFLADDERTRDRAAAAAAQAMLRSDIVMVSGKARSGLQGGPVANDLLPLWRDLALSGSPGEASLSALASVRPVVASHELTWGAAIGRHLIPAELVDRVAPEPRGTSDRRRALDAFAPARQQLSTRLAGDPDLRAVTEALLHARAMLLASIGDRDLAERAAADARLFGRP